MPGQVGSGYLDPTRSDPPGSGPDPTRRSCQYSGPDPTQPDPTRPAGRPDPGTTLISTYLGIINLLAP